MKRNSMPRMTFGAMMVGAVVATSPGMASAELLKRMDFEDARVETRSPGPARTKWNIVDPEGGSDVVYKNIFTSITDDGMLRPVICTANSTTGGCPSIPARSGNKYLMMPTQASGETNTREEFMLMPEYVKAGETVFLGFSFRVDGGWNPPGFSEPIETEGFRRNIQLAAGDDGCGGFSHSLTWYWMRDRITVRSARGASELGKPCTSGGQYRQDLGTFFFQKNIWYDAIVMFRMDPSAAANGLVKVWIKKSSDASYGTKIVDYSGKVGWSNNGPNVKYETRMGHYGRSHSSGLKLYFDEIRLGKPNDSSFDEVNPDRR